MTRNDCVVFDGIKTDNHLQGSLGTNADNFHLTLDSDDLLQYIETAKFIFCKINIFLTDQ